MKSPLRVLRTIAAGLLLGLTYSSALADPTLPAASGQTATKAATDALDTRLDTAEASITSNTSALAGKASLSGAAFSGPVTLQTASTWSTNTVAANAAYVRDVLSKISPVFNVAEDGAIPNDGLDDTAAVTTTFTKAAAVGGVVFFPPGTWKGNWTWPQQVGIKGGGGCNTLSGTPKTIIVPNSNSAPVFYISGTYGTANALAGQWIEDLNIHGAGIGTSTSSAIKAGAGTGFTGTGLYARNVFIKEFAIGFHFLAAILINLDNCSAPQCTNNLRAEATVSLGDRSSTINVRGGGWGGLVGGGTLDGITAFHVEHCFAFSITDAEIGNCERVALVDDSQFEIERCNLESVAGSHAIRAQGSRIAVTRSRFSRHSGPATTSLVRVSGDDSRVEISGVTMPSGTTGEFDNSGSLGAPVMIQANGINDPFKKLILAGTNGVVRISSMSDFSDNFASLVPAAVQWVTPAPSAANSHGAIGAIATDGSYLYIATSWNTWKRVAISSW